MQARSRPVVDERRQVGGGNAVPIQQDPVTALDRRERAPFVRDVIVGAGAVGAACARELAVAGRRVLVVYRGTPDGEAWRAAAGMLAPQIEAVPEDPLFDLGLAGRERYTMLAPALLSSTGIDIGLWQEGIASLQRQQGHHCNWLDADEVKAQWPWVGASHGALWAPREGAVDPVRLVEALLADARAHGAVMVQDQVTHL